VKFFCEFLDVSFFVKRLVFPSLMVQFYTPISLETSRNQPILTNGSSSMKFRWSPSTRRHRILHHLHKWKSMHFSKFEFPAKNISSLSNQFSTHSNFHHKFSSLLLIKTLKLDHHKCFSFSYSFNFSPIFSFSLFFHLKLTHHKIIQTFLFFSNSINTKLFNYFPK
jgi:hypothetical protein